VPTGWALDGRSFLPQPRGAKGNPRDWYYCWYAPRNGVLRAEFAASARYKLYRSGAVYDLTQDPTEEHPLRAEKG
jgi:arylsulfatase A